MIGRNGAGKSRSLRALDEGYSADPAYNVRYISPERAGVFQRQGHISTNMEQDKNWLRSVRRRNQAADFKAASATLLAELETAYNRRILKTPALRDDHSRSFANDLLRRISGLLANIAVEQEGSGFVFVTADGSKITADEISSGESEAIALASEILYFFETLDPLRFNLLLLDEPDVHLHPDLQARLAQFLITSLNAVTEDLRDKAAVCLSTHSTPFICALASSSLTSIGTKNFQETAINFERASAQLKKVAPFFGHPLSLTLNNEVMLILEGEDDERVWQQAARSSQGRIRVFPVVATSVNQQTEVEAFASDVLEALFDNPKALSIRDGDGQRGALSSVGVVTRFRLQCYEIENTLVTDEVLRAMGHTWDTFQIEAGEWMSVNTTHKDLELVRRVSESPDRLRDVKIKSIRQLICSIAGSNKPWEVVVGQVLGTIPFAPAAAETSILSFVGFDAASALLA
ncbi:MAG: AAA family ATPase [Pseudomonadota bacterium]